MHSTFFVVLFRVSQSLLLALTYATQVYALVTKLEFFYLRVLVHKLSDTQSLLTPRVPLQLFMNGKEKYIEKYFNKQKKMKYRQHLFEEILRAEEAQKKTREL